MSVAFADNDRAYEEYVRDELRLVGEKLETRRALRAERDKLIVDMYSLGHTQTEIARVAHLDQSAVSRVITAHRRDSLLRSAQQSVQDETTTEGDI